jgi:hypothetical protein
VKKTRGLAGETGVAGGGTCNCGGAVATPSPASPGEALRLPSPGDLPGFPPGDARTPPSSSNGGMRVSAGFPGGAGLDTIYALGAPNPSLTPNSRGCCLWVEVVGLGG